MSACGVVCADILRQEGALSSFRDSKKAIATLLTGAASLTPATHLSETLRKISFTSCTSFSFEDFHIQLFPSIPFLSKKFRSRRHASSAEYVFVFENRCVSACKIYLNMLSDNVLHRIAIQPLSFVKSSHSLRLAPCYSRLSAAFFSVTSTMPSFWANTGMQRGQAPHENRELFSIGCDIHKTPVINIK